MPWWGWLLVGVGGIAALGLAWLGLYVYLMSRGD